MGSTACGTRSARPTGPFEVHRTAVAEHVSPPRLISSLEAAGGLDRPRIGRTAGFLTVRVPDCQGLEICRTRTIHVIAGAVRDKTRGSVVSRHVRIAAISLVA